MMHNCDFDGMNRTCSLISFILATIAFTASNASVFKAELSFAAASPTYIHTYMNFKIVTIELNCLLQKSKIYTYINNTYIHTYIQLPEIKQT